LSLTLRRQPASSSADLARFLAVYLSRILADRESLLSGVADSVAGTSDDLQ